MIDRQELEGHWKQIVGQVREKWGQVTDDELQKAQGSTEKLIGVIQQKTGESKRVVEEFLQGVVDEGSSVVQRVKDVAQGVAERAQEEYQHVSDKVREGYDEAGQLVRHRPMQSIAAVFGVGLIAGLLASILLRSRS